MKDIILTKLEKRGYTVYVKLRKQQLKRNQCANAMGSIPACGESNDCTGCADFERRSAIRINRK